MKAFTPFRKYALAGSLALVLAGLSAPAPAADTVKIAEITELTGPGATSGTNFKNGVDLAVKEINDAGGILGRQIETTSADTQTNPGIAKGLAQKAIDDDAFAVFGPVFSGSIMVSMVVTEEAKVPNFIGGEAASITQRGNPYVFRTSLTQADAMPKIARYLDGRKDIASIAVIFVNDDFGKGGRDAIIEALKSTHVKVVEDISTSSSQVDFSAAVLKAKQSKADAIFAYLHEEESARLLRELKKQGWDKPIIGETTLTGQKVVELAGPAAEGAIAHVGLTVDAPLRGMKKFNEDFQKAYGYVSDHNGIKGYTGVYMLKAAIEKVGKFDREAVAQALHGLHISVGEHPGVLMDVTIDDKGDLDRESFLVHVDNGRQKVREILPPLSKK
ncbi:ABC transporter substrate-binding protein [Castellaniella defragrans]|uniref:Branched-chain amino acid transport system substrate-binding protein n=1 Tax=Castellaniella defragrans TaxID=75697 RepID=A0A7W9TTN3_CASDE|nr:ABC transporter substrate-binding protein [Castellaniella defragrans]KAB0622935.1 amino acid ABC transporter substrate-binding protein [Castellaniella defragrans]MBB6085352.1 branched-chain amino acid transport system substrate-binding protein [Castellaniella defragrans]